MLLAAALLALAQPAAPAPAQAPVAATQGRILALPDEAVAYVPAGAGANPPLLVLLHGAGRDAGEWSSGPLASLVDGDGIVVVGPDSRGTTWDRIRGDYGPDVRFIDQALALAFRRCNVDAARVGLGGFSDGASYALSLGISNGDLFRALLAFSPGTLAPEAQVGSPRIFVSHGTRDTVLPIDRCSRRIVRRRIVFTEAREGRDLGVVRERRDRADRWIAASAAHEALEPAFTHDRVGVEQHDIGARQRHAAIGRPREAQVARVAQHDHVRERAALERTQILADARIRRGIVDEHQPIRAFGVSQHGFDAAREIVRSVVHRHDDVDLDGGRCAQPRAPVTRRHARRTRSHGSCSHQRALCR